MRDVIYRQDAIDAFMGLFARIETDTIGFYEIEYILFELPSAESEQLSDAEQ